MLSMDSNTTCDSAMRNVSFCPVVVMITLSLSTKCVVFGACQVDYKRLDKPILEQIDDDYTRHPGLVYCPRSPRSLRENLQYAMHSTGASRAALPRLDEFTGRTDAACSPKLGVEAADVHLVRRMRSCCYWTLTTILFVPKLLERDTRAEPGHVCKFAVT